MTLTQTLNDTGKFERHRSGLEHAGKILELSRRAYKKYSRKMEEVVMEEAGISVVVDLQETLRQAQVALAIYHRAWKYYKKIIGQLSHQ